MGEESVIVSGEANIIGTGVLFLLVNILIERSEVVFGSCRDKYMEINLYKSKGKGKVIPLQARCGWHVS